MKRGKQAPETPRAGQAVALPASEKHRDVLTIEEEALLLAIVYPSDGVAKVLEGVTWLEERCQQAWDVLRDQVARGSVNVSEVLSTLPEATQQWLMQLGVEQRTYNHPLPVLEGLADGIRRQALVVKMQDLKQEIDSMIEGRMPMDTEKVQTYHDLSKRLKGSRPSREAPLHG
jgi:hypothetical protein